MALNWKRRTAGVVQILFLLGVYSTCSLFERSGPEIIDFNPGEGYVESLDNLNISLSFSAGMDKTSVEEGFTLTRDGEVQEGTFLWKENRMIFKPSIPVGKGFDYHMLCETSAEDAAGRDLTAEFSNRFSTRKEHIRPAVLSSLPVDGSVQQQLRPEIEIRFSEPMDPCSIYTAFRTTPVMTGTFGWGEEGSVMRFIPDRDLVRGQEYRIELSEETSDREGNRLGEPFTFSFRLGPETGSPVTVSASSEQGDITLLPAESDTPFQSVTEGWERWWNIVLTFSEEVACRELEQKISLSPSAGFSLGKDGGLHGRTFILTPDEPLPFDEICTLRIDATVQGISGNTLKPDTLFYFQTNGPGSLPPEVSRVTFLKDPSSGLICECVPCGPLDLSGYVPHPGGAGTGFFDIYVQTAESAALLPTECMEHFSIELSGDCASIVPVFVETAALPAPAPDPPPQAGEQLLRIYVDIEDRPSCGTVILRLAPGFKDSNGNSLEAEWICILNEATP
jgi:hypothetical protein